jgi:integrase
MISFTDGNNSKRLIHMANMHLQLVAPTNEKRTVAPRRRPNTDYRTREYLTEIEVEKLIAAAGDNRHGHRDATMILIAFRHGLRASELVGLRWDQIDFEGGVLHVARRKRGTPSTQPISGRELRALRRLKREAKPSPFVFVSERGSPFSVAGFQKLVARAGVASGFAFQLHPHMLRHACGFKLANDGVDTRSLQAYLGHRSIQHTVRYTELAPGRFKGFWRD